MTPFPEAEIMTIKRLEVALRKMDFKLLKDGAYKLHEKFHSGHKFEYIDLLKDLLVEILNNPSIPSDIKDILCPTIEDILSEASVENPMGQEIISSLTSLSYNALNAQEASYQEVQGESLEPSYTEPIFEKIEKVASEPKFELQEEVKINAFDAFSPQKSQAEEPKRFFTQSPFSAEPFKEFNHSALQLGNFEQKNEDSQFASPQFEVMQNSTQEEIEELIQEKPEQLDDEQMQIKEERVEQIVTPEPVKAQQVQITQSEYNALIQEQQEEKAQEKKLVAIFYSQDNSKEKIKNILQYKEIIASTNEKNATIDDLMALISEITTQANTNTIELQGVLKQLSANGNKINLITNSQSEMLVELLDSIDLTYDLYKNDENNKVNLLPLYGLSNLFYCSECKQKYLDKSSEVKPLVLECPQCKNPMYPDFWASNEEAKINLQYYNESLINLANSPIWLIIHPTYNDKISSDLIESALRISNVVKEVYILDKDINIRENYKNFISKINSNIKVNAHNNTLEEFFKVI